MSGSERGLLTQGFGDAPSWEKLRAWEGQPRLLQKKRGLEEGGGENKDRGYREFGTVHCDIFRN